MGDKARRQIQKRVGLLGEVLGVAGRHHLADVADDHCHLTGGERRERLVHVE